MRNLADAIRLELEIFATAAMLADLRWARAKRLYACHRRSRLAHLEDARLALVAYRDAHRAWDVAEDAARRVARLLDQDRSDWAQLAHMVRGEIDAHESA